MSDETPPPPWNPTCPKCGAPMQDLRGAGFSTIALAIEGACYRWSDTDYTCNGSRKPSPR